MDTKPTLESLQDLFASMRQTPAQKRLWEIAEKFYQENYSECDRCEQDFHNDELQTYEDSRGNERILCEHCEHNYPDEPNDDIDEDHNSDR